VENMSIQAACQEYGYAEIEALSIDQSGTVLYINYCFITEDIDADCILDFLPELENLKDIAVDHSLLQDDIDSISKCAMLETISFNSSLQQLDYSGLTGLQNLQTMTILIDRPKDIQLMPQLPYITELKVNISANFVVDYNEMSLMPSLQVLGICNPIDLSFISNYPNVNGLFVEYNRGVLEEDKPLNILQTLPDGTLLMNLGIINASLYDLSGIGGASQLENLSISDSNLQELTGIEALAELKSLYIGYNQVQSLLPLESLEQLEYVEFTGNEVSNLHGVENKQYLEELYGTENPITNSQHVLEVLASLPALGYFEFDYVTFTKAELDEAGIKAHSINKQIYHSN